MNEICNKDRKTHNSEIWILRNNYAKINWLKYCIIIYVHCSLCTVNTNERVNNTIEKSFCKSIAIAFNKNSHFTKWMKSNNFFFRNSFIWVKHFTPAKNLTLRRFLHAHFYDSIRYIHIYILCLMDALFYHRSFVEKCNAK